MSRKPPKKSDMGKSWMKPRRDSRQMISPEYHLIVSEGTKTEPKSRNLGTYYKNRTDMFDVLRPYMDDAIRNAKMLEEINTGKIPSKSTPGTMVHHLIETLKPYL